MSDNIIKDLIKTLHSVSGECFPLVEYKDRPWVNKGMDVMWYYDGEEYTGEKWGVGSRSHGHYWVNVGLGTGIIVTYVFPESKEVSAEEFEELIYG